MSDRAILERLKDLVAEHAPEPWAVAVMKKIDDELADMEKQ